MSRVRRNLSLSSRGSFQPDGTVEIQLSAYDKEQLAALLEDICYDNDLFLDSARTWACALLKELNATDDR